jgi:hypothetical protein
MTKQKRRGLPRNHRSDPTEETRKPSLKSVDLVLLFILFVCVFSGVGHVLRHHRYTLAPTLYEASVSVSTHSHDGCVVLYEVYPCYVWDGHRVCMPMVGTDGQLEGIDETGEWTRLHLPNKDFSCIRQMHHRIVTTHMHSIGYV